MRGRECIAWIIHVIATPMYSRTLVSGTLTSINPMDPLPGGGCCSHPLTSVIMSPHLEQVMSCCGSCTPFRGLVRAYTGPFECRESRQLQLDALLPMSWSLAGTTERCVTRGAGVIHTQAPNRPGACGDAIAPPASVRTLSAPRARCSCKKSACKTSATTSTSSWIFY